MEAPQSMPGVNRKSKSKENYSKNKTFEFPQNYLKSIITSKAELMGEETPKQTQFNVSMMKAHNRSSSKKKHISRRNDCR